VKSFAESVFSQSSAFRKVVMLEYPRPGIWSIGFLTAEDVPQVSARIGEPHAAVYISAALNATAGVLVIVPRRQLVELDPERIFDIRRELRCGDEDDHHLRRGGTACAACTAAAADLKSCTRCACMPQARRCAWRN
jgi:hypothetical protein